MMHYVFDCGEVLFHISLTHCIRQYVNDDRDVDVIRTFLIEHFMRLDDGKITEETLLPNLLPLVSDASKPGTIEVMKHWPEHLLPIEENHALVSELKANGKCLFLLSNMAKSYDDYTKRTAFFDNFDGIVISGAVGMKKPDEEIFIYLLKRYGLHAEDCLFIDDREDNLQTAQRLGFKTYPYDGDPQKLRNYIKNCGGIV